MMQTTGTLVAIALAALTFPPFRAAGEAGMNVCSKTARAASHACEAGAQDDYWTSYGRCTNDGGSAASDACKSTAKTERSDALDDCAAQTKARLDLCGVLGQAAYQPVLSPSDFLSKAQIVANPNPYWPLIPGSVWHYAGGGELNTVTVTDQTRDFDGITTIVVHDVVTVGGETAEDTNDYYAQDVQGNVWYFGEISQGFENGDLVSLEGSWLTGVDFAKPGIVMKGTRTVGDVYRQEFLLGEAEDVAEITSTTGTESTPGASCSGTCFVTRETSGLEPDVAEAKYYVAGIGVILEVDLETLDRVELLDYTPGP